MGEYEDKMYPFPTIIKGDDFNWDMQIKDDAGNPMTGLTGATLTCIVKAYAGGPTLVDYSSKFVLTEVTAKINFDLLTSETNAITWSKGVYKLKLNLSSGAVKTLLYGTMKADLG
jgi:hypothetical protein